MREQQINGRRNTELLLLLLAAVPVGLLYAMYLVSDKVALSISAFAVPLGLLVAFTGAHLAVRRLAPAADPVILPLVFVLSGIGITFVSRLTGGQTNSQVIWLFVSVAAMVATLYFVPSLDQLAEYKFTLGIAGIVLLLIPMIFGTEINGSRLWLRLGPLSFQPGELAKILIILFLAAYLAENREMLSASMRHIGPLALPRPRMLAPMLVMWGISLLVVVFERDLGSALLFFSFFVLMLFVCTGRPSYVIFFFLLLAIGGVFCFKFFGHVQTRVHMWLDPTQDRWGSGMQILQSLYSLADGGMSGTGIGKGLAAQTVTFVQSDFIFAAIGEELGLLGASAVLICYLLLAVRGLATAARARSDVSAFTAAGLTAAIAVQAFVIVGGVTKMLPLTGVTLPFMSQGGSSLLASFIIIGLLLRAGDEGTGHGVQVETSDSIKFNTTQNPALSGARTASSVVHGAHARGRYSMLTPESGVLGRVALGKRLTVVVSVFSLMFAALIANLTYVQVIHAETLQHDQYNTHTALKARRVQRGSIVTSDEVTLAESVLQADGSYQRNHPQGSLAVHTVGFVSTGEITGVELAANDALKGDADFSNLHNALLSLAGVPNAGSSVVLTLNSQMQRAAERALEGYVGAITVLDPSTGAVLAKASSPTYSYDQSGYIVADDKNSPLVDRTTRALYAPGSTFKTLTLGAALDLKRTTLETSYPAPASMDFGGAAVTNFENNSWESLSAKDAFANSANTVFAQIGSQVGAKNLISYAQAAGYGSSIGQDFSTLPSTMPAADEMSEWETAWAAAGQPVGQHKGNNGPYTTVMQNAVLAAAVANGGEAMQPYVIDHIVSHEGTTTSETKPVSLGKVFSASTADQLKEAMLSVVESGTGGGAAIRGVQVTGKTGTAETNNGKWSNSLFIGFAPYKNPTVAISVVIEQVDDNSVHGVATTVAGEVLAACLNVQAAGAS